MRVLLLTNEYPPNVYGGAGVHVEYLARELAHITGVETRTFGDQALEQGQLRVRGTKVDAAPFSGCPPGFVSPLKALATCLAFNGQGTDADVVHCHTWYTHFGGILAKILYGLPLVITVHSLEPLRPWKREQLGHGYDLSSWLEKTTLEMADAVIAVSESTKADIERLFDVDPAKIAVIPNGIDTDEYTVVHDPATLHRYGIEPEVPYVLFVGRMTRQKGLIHLLRAIPALDPSAQVVLCAGDADTPEMGREIETAVRRLQEQREGIVWIPEMLPRQSVAALYAQASVFCCPSIYEPFGIINLEAMACATPVVASAVGGIVEVVVDGETGFLVETGTCDEATLEPIDPDGFARRLAEAINRLIVDAELRQRMGERGRERVIQHYSWQAIARRTLTLYEELRMAATG